MGLDDIIPDDSNSSSRSSPSSTSGSDGPEIVREIGGGEYQKRFTEEQWEKVKRVIRSKMDYSVDAVLNMRSEERYEVLHEAVTYNPDVEEGVSEEHKTTLDCYHCGNDCSGGYVELEGERFCMQHPAAQVAKALGKSIKDRL